MCDEGVGGKQLERGDALSPEHSKLLLHLSHDGAVKASDLKRKSKGKFYKWAKGKAVFG